MNIYGEALIVGTISMVVGIIVFDAVAKLYPSRLPEEKGETRFYLLMLVKGGLRPGLGTSFVVFLTGFLGHLFFEFTGMNKRLHRWTGVWLW